MMIHDHQHLEEGKGDSPLNILPLTYQRSDIMFLKQSSEFNVVFFLVNLAEYVTLCKMTEHKQTLFVNCKK